MITLTGWRITLVSRHSPVNEHTATTAAPGTELKQNGEAVGEVVLGAAWAGEAGVIAEVQLAAWEAEAPLTLADGSPLTRAALPYAVKAPE